MESYFYIECDSQPFDPFLYIKKIKNKNTNSHRKKYTIEKVASQGSDEQSIHQNDFEVEKILKKRQINGRVQYLIKWAGFQNQTTWEFPENLKYIQNMIIKFEGMIKTQELQRKRKTLDIYGAYSYDFSHQGRNLVLMKDTETNSFNFQLIEDNLIDVDAITGIRSHQYNQIIVEEDECDNFHQNMLQSITSIGQLNNANLKEVSNFSQQLRIQSEIQDEQFLLDKSFSCMSERSVILKPISLKVVQFNKRKRPINLSYQQDSLNDNAMMKSIKLKGSNSEQLHHN